MNPTVDRALPGTNVTLSTSSGLLLPKRNRRVYAYVQNTDASIVMKVSSSQAVLDGGGGESLSAGETYRHDGRSELYGIAASGTPVAGCLEFVGSGGEGKLGRQSTVTVTGRATLLLPRDPKRVKATIRNNDGSKQLTVGQTNIANGLLGIIIATGKHKDFYGEAPVWGIAPPTNEVQTITYGAVPDAGNYKLEFHWPDGSIETTANIAFGAAASAIDTAIEALAHVGSGGTTVSGTTGQGPFTVTFGGGLVANTDVPTILVVANTMTVSAVPVSVTIATTTVGASGSLVAGIDATYKS